MKCISSLSRRRFLKGAACGLIAAGGGVLSELDVLAGNERIRWGIIVDARRCPPDCTACVDACAKENALISTGRPNIDPQWIRKLRVTDKATGLVSNFPLMCQHCAEAECVKVCPTGATYRRADGIVLINRHKCIGCRYCVVSCPFKVRGFVFEKVVNQAPGSPRGAGTADGCTMCSHRIDAGGRPACVEACAKVGHNAMVFGNLNDPTAPAAKLVVAFGTTALRPDLLTDPGVRYQGLNP